MLESRAHVDSFTDPPNAQLVTLGPTIARVERAVLSIDEIARVHVARWGDGSGHFHLWFLPRPLGALHMRGSGLIPWVEAMDPPASEVLVAAHEAIASAMSKTSLSE